MLELYDAFYSSLIGKNHSDSVKYEKEYCHNFMCNIQEFLQNNEGKMAILIKTDGKKSLPPKLVKIQKVYNGKAILVYKVYDNYGNFRQEMSEFIRCESIYCRQVKLRVFGDI